MAPANPAWSRVRKPHHGGAHRNCTQTTPTYSRLSPAKCSDCDSLQVEVTMPTCRVTKGNLLVEPCAMPVDCQALHSSERVDIDVMADNTLCQEATVEINCLEDGIPDFDLLDVIDQQSKLAQSCELITLQTQIVLSVALHACAVLVWRSPLIEHTDHNRLSGSMQTCSCSHCMV